MFGFCWYGATAGLCAFPPRPFPPQLAPAHLHGTSRAPSPALAHGAQRGQHRSETCTWFHCSHLYSQAKVGTLFPSWRTAFMASAALFHPAGREVARTGLSLPCALTAARCQCPRLVPALCSAPPARMFPIAFDEVQGSFSLCGNSQSHSWLAEGPA